MQTLPICRATSAAWLVMPPNAVMKPSDAFMPRMSSGLVSWRHRIRLVSPLAASASASSAKNTTLPVAAPGPAGRPLASSRPSAIAAFFAAGRNTGRRSWFSASGSTRRSASSFEISFSSTISTAMRTPAKPVRLPLRHWSMYRTPFSIVNSMSCISL